MNLSESYKKRLNKLAGLVNEEFSIVQNTLEITEPYDNIQKIIIGNRDIYILFGNVEYYKNKESILAIKRKSEKLQLNHQAYANFLKEFARRFNSINESRKADMVISIETTSPVTSEMASVLQIPYIKNGFKKINSLFKMKDVDVQDRENIKDLFNIDFQLDDSKVICVMDDFLTSGNTFKNAFDKLPDNVNAFGICLFKLNS